MEQREAQEQLDELVAVGGYPGHRAGWLDWALQALMPDEAERRKAGANAQKKKKRAQARTCRSPRRRTCPGERLSRLARGQTT